MMEAHMWDLVDRLTSTRWWFGWPMVIVGTSLGIALLLAVARLHRRSPLVILLTATALGGAAALLLPGLWLAWQPIAALGVDLHALPQAPTAAFPAIAQTYERALQFSALGCAALVIGTIGTTGLFRDRRVDACPTCGRARHASWKGICPECQLLEPRPTDAALVRLGSLSSDHHSITQFGVSAHTELLEGAATQTAWLEVVDGPSSISERFAIGGRITIGRDPHQCQCVLDDDAISARHATIECDRQGFVLSDSGSRNGTYVNGQRSSQHVLRNDDLIGLGHSVLRFIATDIAAENTPTVLLDTATCGAQLVALNGAEQGTVFPIRQLDVRIGRGKQNEIKLDTATVSRQHASVRFDGSGYHLVDLGSPNGVWLDGARVLGSAPLRHGQQIVLGEQQLRFELEEAARAATT